MTTTPTPRIVLPGDPLVEGDTALRPWRDTDLPELVQACRDPEIVRWTSVPAGYTEADAHNYLRQRYDAAFAGLTAPFAVVHAAEALRGSGATPATGRRAAARLRRHARSGAAVEIGRAHV